MARPASEPKKIRFIKDYVMKNNNYRTGKTGTKYTKGTEVVVDASKASHFINRGVAEEVKETKQQPQQVKTTAPAFNPEIKKS